MATGRALAAVGGNQVMEGRFVDRVLASAARVPVPISTYPGLSLTGARVVDVLSNAQAQVDTQFALHRRLDTAVLLSAMDLSAEAEAFGSEIHFSNDEIPRVAKPLVASREDVRRLAIPTPGDRRTSVHLTSIRMMRRSAPEAVVIGGTIGPFSLTSQLVGVTQLMTLCLEDPDLVEAILEKATAFLTGYVRAFADAGADAVLMAEPVAGLVSPALLGRFSSANVARINQAVEAGSFQVFLHNCGARLKHLPQVLESGVSLYHFGAPMDIGAALRQVPLDVVLAGNLDPAAVFCRGTAGSVAQSTASLLAATDGHRNFVPSSGCDLPPGTPLENLEAFYEAVAASNEARSRAEARDTD
jgi:uroporphyrinogen decarboxylase